jgi:hypothetical protein
VPGDRLLRRHPRLRRATESRLPPVTSRTGSPRGGATAGCPRSRTRRATSPRRVLQRHATRRQLLPQEPQQRAHGGALRRAHRRPLPLLPALQRQRRGPRHQPGLRVPAQEHLPGQQQRDLPQHDHGHGPHDAGGARQPVLRRARQQPGPLQVGPGAAHRRHGQGLRRRVRQELEEVRQGHEDGRHEVLTGTQGGDQAQLQGRQQRQRGDSDHGRT